MDSKKQVIYRDFEIKFKTCTNKTNTLSGVANSGPAEFSANPNKNSPDYSFLAV